MFANLAILVSFIFVGSQILKEEGLSFNSPLMTRVFVGIFAGTLGLVLMNYHFEVKVAFIDLRYIPIMVASFLGGVLPGLIATIIVALGRLFLLNSGTYPTVVAVSGIVSIGLISVSLSHWLRHWPKNYLWSMLTGNSLLIGNFVLYLFTKDFMIMFTMTVIFLIASYVVYTSLSFVQESNRLYRKFKKESVQDPLTGLNNKRTFNDLLDKFMDNQEDLALLVVDIDHFKEVNDVYGHLRGDAVLKKVGTILIENSRSHDIVSRHGGEEFTILLPHCTQEQALEIGERIRKTVEDYVIEIEGIRIQVTVSIGISTKSSLTLNSNQIFQFADEALYRAKNNGRNRVEV